MSAAQGPWITSAAGLAERFGWSQEELAQGISLLISEGFLEPTGVPDEYYLTSPEPVKFRVSRSKTATHRAARKSQKAARRKNRRAK